MTDAKKLIWICPLCTRTFRTEEVFREHLKAKARRIDRAINHPNEHTKEVRGE